MGTEQIEKIISEYEENLAIWEKMPSMTYQEVEGKYGKIHEDWEFLVWSHKEFLDFTYLRMRLSNGEIKELKIR